MDLYKDDKRFYQGLLQVVAVMISLCEILNDGAAGAGELSGRGGDEFYLTENIIFGGRLAEYRYYNMDAVVERALQVAKEVIRKYAKC